MGQTIGSSIPQNEKSQGQRDLPTLTPLAIDGVFAARARVIEYNSSRLTEAYRLGWAGLYDAPLEHLYWISAPQGTARGWGSHEHTTDRYSAVVGDFEVALFDGRAHSSTHATLLVITLTADSGDGLLIPPGVWHAYRCLSQPTVFLNSKTPPWSPTRGDKQVIPMPNEFTDFTWERKTG